MCVAGLTVWWNWSEGPGLVRGSMRETGRLGWSGLPEPLGHRAHRWGRAVRRKGSCHHDNSWDGWAYLNN